MLRVDAGAQVVRDEQHVLRSTQHVHVSENWRAFACFFAEISSSVGRLSLSLDASRLEQNDLRHSDINISLNTTFLRLYLLSCSFAYMIRDTFAMFPGAFADAPARNRDPMTLCFIQS